MSLTACGIISCGMLMSAISLTQITLLTLSTFAIFSFKAATSFDGISSITKNDIEALLKVSSSSFSPLTESRSPGRYERIS